MFRKILFLLSFLAMSTVVYGQRYDNIALSTQGKPIPGASVAVCSQPATTSGTPCSPLATLYTDKTFTTTTTNPVTADINGNYHFYYNPLNGLFTVQVYGAPITVPFVMTDQSVGMGSGSFLGNNTTVLDAGFFPGATWDAKVNNAISACLTAGCVIDARGLVGAQSLAANVTFGTTVQSITILLGDGLVLTRASGAQFLIGSNGRLIGTGRGSSVITGNDTAAAIGGIYSSGPPSNVEISNLSVTNANIGPCVNFLNTSAGSLSANIHDNVFSCATGVLTTGYWNRIWNNTFNASTGGVFWAGTVGDDHGGGQFNSNHIYDNLYFGGSHGTGDFLRSGSGGYNNLYDGAQDYEGDNLAVFVSATSSKFDLNGDNENNYCDGRTGWVATTA